jgi:dienelactone hydrolase
VNFHFFGGELKTFDWFDDLNRIRCPTLILAGEVDPIATVLDHEELAAAISGSRLEVFSDAGHGVFRDKPDQALAIIRDFIHDPAQGALRNTRAADGRGVSSQRIADSGASRAASALSRRDSARRGG